MSHKDNTSVARKKIIKLKLTFNFRRMLEESVMVTFTDYLSFGILFFINVFINKFYGTVELGIFALIYAIAQISVMSIGSGFSGILRRDISIDHTLAGRYISGILKLRIIIMLACILCITAGYYIFYKQESSFIYFLLLMLSAKGFDLCSETIYTTYQSLHEVKRFTIFKTSNFLLLGIFALSCCYFQWPLHWLYEIHFIVSLTFFILNFIYFHHKQERLRHHILSNNKLARYLVQETWPILVNSVFFTLSSRASIIIIELINGTKLQGMYSLGITIITALTAFSNSISIVLFPYLTRIYKNESSRLLPVINKVSLVFGACSIVLLLFYRIIQPYLLRYVGELPPEAEQVFSILSLSVIPLFLSALIGYIFTIIGKQQAGMYISAIILLVNVTGFYFLSVRFGITGSAIAFVVCQSIGFLIMYVWAYKLLKGDNKALPDLNQ